MNEFSFSEFYDRQPDYEAFRSDPESMRYYEAAVIWKVNRLVSLVPEKLQFDSMLEVGCAMGVLMNKIADRLNIDSRTGVDISGENIKKARELFPGCNFFCGTVEDLVNDQKGGGTKVKYSLVVLSDIVEHIPDDRKFLESVSSLADYVLFNLPLEKCFRNRKRKYGLTDPSGHLRNYSAEDAMHLVQSAGFSVISSLVTNAHFDQEYFRLYRAKRKARILAKNIPRKFFWSIYYNFEDLIRVAIPPLYIRIYGANFFALMKTA